MPHLSEISLYLIDMLTGVGLIAPIIGPIFDRPGEARAVLQVVLKSNLCKTANSKRLEMLGLTLFAQPVNPYFLVLK